MRRTSRHSGSFIFKFKNVWYDVEWSGKWCHDPYFGGDADDNRSWPEWSIDELMWVVIDPEGDTVSNLAVEIEAEKLLNEEIDSLTFEE